MQAIAFDPDLNQVVQSLSFEEMTLLTTQEEGNSQPNKDPEKCWNALQYIT